MAKCFFCGAETRLYAGETPVCIECDDKRSKPQTGKPRGKEGRSQTPRPDVSKTGQRPSS
jgi:hypothetical protein